MISKEVAADALFAKHMNLLLAALMQVATFSVCAMWTTFWPLVWVAVPAALFAMVAAGLIGTAPTATARETITYRAGAIKMCAVVSLILTIVSFLSAAVLGGLMVAQAVTAVDTCLKGLIQQPLEAHKAEQHNNEPPHRRRRKRM